MYNGEFFFVENPLNRYMLSQAALPLNLQVFAGVKLLESPLDNRVRSARINVNCGVGGRLLHVEGPTYREPGEIPGRSPPL